MRVAVASGKGGTGKTTVAVGLAEALASEGKGSSGAAVHPPVTLLDCDVEEPNAHLFLGAEETRRRPFPVKVPRIEERTCTACGDCVEFCQFNALVRLGRKVMVFDNLCHACGGCRMVCPEGAIREAERPIGELVEGQVPASAGGGDPALKTLYGILDVGETLVPALIRAVKREGAAGRVNRSSGPVRDTETHGGERNDIIIDSPPGTSCPMVTSVKDADFTLLVTENTPFGLHDLELAVETLSELDIPMGVVINRADVGHAGVEEYCRRKEIPVLLKIPYDEQVAAGYARGESLLRSAPAYGAQLRGVYAEMRRILQARRST